MMVYGRKEFHRESATQRIGISSLEGQRLAALGDCVTNCATGHSAEPLVLAMSASLAGAQPARRLLTLP